MDYGSIFRLNMLNMSELLSAPLPPPLPPSPQMEKQPLSPRIAANGAYQDKGGLDSKSTDPYIDKNDSLPDRVVGGDKVLDVGNVHRSRRAQRLGTYQCHEIVDEITEDKPKGETEEEEKASERKENESGKPEPRSGSELIGFAQEQILNVTDENNHSSNRIKNGLPAQPSSPEFPKMDNTHEERKKLNKTRKKIKVACEACRLKKKKCDGAKPICSPCKAIYDKKLLTNVARQQQQQRQKRKKGSGKIEKNGSWKEGSGCEVVVFPDCHYRNRDIEEQGPVPGKDKGLKTIPEVHSKVDFIKVLSASSLSEAVSSVPAANTTNEDSIQRFKYKSTNNSNHYRSIASNSNVDSSANVNANVNGNYKSSNDCDNNSGDSNSAIASNLEIPSIFFPSTPSSYYIAASAPIPKPSPGVCKLGHPSHSKTINIDSSSNSAPLSNSSYGHCYNNIDMNGQQPDNKVTFNGYRNSSGDDVDVNYMYKSDTQDTANANLPDTLNGIWDNASASISKLSSKVSKLIRVLDTQSHNKEIHSANTSIISIRNSTGCDFNATGDDDDDDDDDDNNNNGKDYNSINTRSLLINPAILDISANLKLLNSQNQQLLDAKRAMESRQMSSYYFSTKFSPPDSLTDSFNGVDNHNQLNHNESYSRANNNSDDNNARNRHSFSNENNNGTVNSGDVHQQFYAGYWDRSVERILKWPIFDGKYDNVSNIKANMQKHGSHALNYEVKFAHMLDKESKSSSSSSSSTSSKSDAKRKSENASIHDGESISDSSDRSNEHGNDSSNNNSDSRSTSNSDSALTVSKSQTQGFKPTGSFLRIDNLIDNPMKLGTMTDLSENNNNDSNGNQAMTRPRLDSQCSNTAKSSTSTKASRQRTSLPEYIDVKNFANLNLHNFKLMAQLEPFFMANVTKWVNDFILHVHTSGNLFMDITVLRESTKRLKKAYKRFLIDRHIKFDYENQDDLNEPEVKYDSIQYGEQKGSFFLDYCNRASICTGYYVNDESDVVRQQLHEVPLFVLLIVCAAGMLSSRYNRSNPRISNYESSLFEREDEGKGKLAYELYKLSIQIEYLAKSYVADVPNVPCSNNCTTSTREFYSLWDIQYQLLLSIYKNFMVKPIEAWHHIYSASSMIIVYLEMRKDDNDSDDDPSTGSALGCQCEDHLQLVQRIFWQCYKNESELKLYLSPLYSSSGILTYKPPFKIRDLRIPTNINNEDPVLKDGWAFYLTEVFVRPIINKICNRFFSKSLKENQKSSLLSSSSSRLIIENNWQSLNQEKFVKIIQDFLKETGNLLKIFEKFLNQQKLSTPLRCADERVVRIKECLCLPLLYHISTVVPLPMPNYTRQQMALRHIDYNAMMHPYLVSFLKDICSQFLRIDDLIQFASERRHGSWYRLRDIYLASLILMIIYKKFGIYFFEKNELSRFIEQTKTIYEYWKDECPEHEHSLQIINTIYKSLPYIS